MTVEPDLELAASPVETDVPVHEPTVHGAIAGHIAVGRYVLEIGEPSGAIVREASPVERAHVRPRPTPVLVRPRPMRALFDRRTEVDAAVAALDRGLPVEVSGAAGIGKTAILRYLAHHPRAASFAGGVVYLPAGGQSPADLLQCIFDAFYESNGICKPTEAEIRGALDHVQALILLDEVRLTQDELEQVLDIAPRSAFVVATRERRLWGEVRHVALNGLPVDAAVQLLEREIERPLDDAERPPATELCARLDGHPLAVVQAAAIARDRAMTPDGWTRDATPECLTTELIASIDEKQRRALLALTAFPGVPLAAPHVAGIAEAVDIESALTALVRSGLVVAGQSRYRLADGVADRLRRSEDLKPWANRAITYFTAWAERHRRSADDLLLESQALLSAQQHAGDARRWGEALLLGRLLEGALVVGARWGAWALTLERCLAAARATGDRAAEAWVLHERGTRALCLGEHAPARASLGQSLTLRDSLEDEAAAAASRGNLSFVLRPISASTGARTTTQLDDVAGAEFLPLRDAPWQTSRKQSTPGVGAALLTLMLFTIVGALGYSATRAVFARSVEPAFAPDVSEALRRGRPEEVVDVRVGTEVELPAADPLAVPTAPAPVADPVSIRIFSPRPGSISTGGRTELCYAVNGAVRVRLHPGVGEVSPTSTLTCLRVAPNRTTTYQLTAYGGDGDEVSRQLVIVVR